MDDAIARRWRELSGENNWGVFFNLYIVISADISFTMRRLGFGSVSTEAPVEPIVRNIEQRFESEVTLTATTFDSGFFWGTK
ncbi:hypothetical protein V6N13_004083 [Hibiscus sabdariffa]